MIIIRNEGELLNNKWSFARLQVRQRIEKFTKRNGRKPNFHGSDLPHVPILGSTSLKCWSLCWTYRSCIRRSKFKQRTMYKRRVMFRLVLSSRFEFCQDRRFYKKTSNLKDECCRKLTIRHLMVPFWKQYTQAGTTFWNVIWQQPTTPCVYSFSRGGDSVIPRISKQYNAVQIVPKFGPFMV